MNSSNDDTLPYEEIKINCLKIFENSTILQKSYPESRHDVLLPILNTTMNKVRKDIQDFL